MRRILWLVLVFTPSLFASLLLIEDSSYIGKRPCYTLESCKPLAEIGNEYARVTLAIVYLEGLGGVDANIEKGLSIIRDAAKNKYALAQTILGLLYLDGTYVKKHNKTSATWFLQAAISGFALAQYHIGKMYLDGIGINQSLDLAVYWIKQASSRGQMDAMKQLGIMYIQGRGVEQNESRGEAWIRRSIATCPVTRIY